MARRAIDSNHYMTLGTLDPDGRPRLSPVFYTCARYSDFYWLSSPEAHHSRNVEERPEIEIVIFDSSVPAGAGEAVYLEAGVRAIRDDELEAICPRRSGRTPAGGRFTPEELRGSYLRLYVAHATSCEVHVAARHPVYGRGQDMRQPAAPASN